MWIQISFRKKKKKTKLFFYKTYRHKVRMNEHKVSGRYVNFDRSSSASGLVAIRSKHSSCPDF